VVALEPEVVYLVPEVLDLGDEATDLAGSGLSELDGSLELGVRPGDLAVCSGALRVEGCLVADRSELRGLGPDSF